MNLYQVGLYRLGQQDANSGWQLVSPSMGISSIAKETFEQIASSIIEAKNRIASPQCRGIFVQDGYTYFINVNFNAKGEDERGVSYAHGYCFPQRSFFELAKQPQKLAGVLEHVFPTEYDNSIENYPVVSELEYADMDWRRIIEKYGISVDTYREMVLGAISAAEKKSNPLCIKKNLAPDQYMQFYNDMLYAIMLGVPEHFRVKLSSFSFRESNRVSMYVSDVVEGDNYVDLDTGEVHAQYSALKKYEFTMIYNNLIQSGDVRVLAALWAMISSQIENTIEKPLRENNLDVVEAAYQATIKKSEAGGIDAASAVDLLTAFTGFGFKDSEATDCYLADILSVINANGLSVDKESVKGKLSERYEQSQDEAFRKQMDVLNGRLLLKEMSLEDAFEALDAMRHTTYEQYKNVYQAIRMEDRNFAYNFYIDKLLEEELIDYDAVKTHLDELKINRDMVSEKLIVQDYLVTLSAVYKIALKQFRSAIDFAELVERLDAVSRCLKRFPTEDGVIKRSESEIRCKLYAAFWDAFDMEWFSTKEYDSYKEYNLATVAEDYTNISETKHAEQVLELTDLMSEGVTPENNRRLQRLLYTREFDLSCDKKNEIRKALGKQWFGSDGASYIDENLKFDVLLTLSYDPGKDIYQIAKFVVNIDKIYKNKAFENQCVMINVRKSQLLKHQDYREQFLQDAGRFIAQNMKGEPDRVRKAKGLKKYVDVINGKELKDEETMEVAANFFTSLYHGLFGSSALGAFLMLAIGVKNFYPWAINAWIPCAVVLVVCFLSYLGVGLINIFRNDGMDGFLENKGLDEAIRLVIYLVLIILPVALFAVLAILNLFVPLAIAIIACMILGCVMMVVSDTFVEE